MFNDANYKYHTSSKYITEWQQGSYTYNVHGVMGFGFNLFSSFSDLTAWIESSFNLIIILQSIVQVCLNTFCFTNCLAL